MFHPIGFKKKKTKVKEKPKKVKKHDQIFNTSTTHLSVFQIFFLQFSSAFLSCDSYHQWESPLAPTEDDRATAVTSSTTTLHRLTITLTLLLRRSHFHRIMTTTTPLTTSLHLYHHRHRSTLVPTVILTITTLSILSISPQLNPIGGVQR